MAYRPGGHVDDTAACAARLIQQPLEHRGVVGRAVAGGTRILDVPVRRDWRRHLFGCEHVAQNDGGDNDDGADQFHGKLSKTCNSNFLMVPPRNVSTLDQRAKGLPVKPFRNGLADEVEDGGGRRFRDGPLGTHRPVCDCLTAAYSPATSQPLR